jgi:hypothetical protein
LRAFCRDDIALRFLGELWNFPPRIIHFLIPIVVIFGLVSSRASRDSRWTHKAALIFNVPRQSCTFLLLLSEPLSPPTCGPFKVDLREYLRDFELWKLLSNAESS